MCHGSAAARASAEHQPFSDSMTDQHSYEVAAGVPETDHDELLYRITADHEHPVMRYVRELPFESAVYPANMYHGLTDRGVSPRMYRKGLITWSPPAHDDSRPKRKGCGFIRERGSIGESGIVYTACSGDSEHYIRGRRTHCWSLHCPECANDTALRMGSRVEEHLNAYRILTEKRGDDPGPLGHWVVSPDQEYAKVSMQTIDGFDPMRKLVTAELQQSGALAGALVFHPWRQGEDEWRLSPHFHSILFGFLDTDGFRERNPGWVVKKVHAGEDMESISQTAAYLFTHMGLGLVERDPLDVDYDLRFLSHMLPGLSDDGYRSTKGADGTYGAGSGRAFRYTEDDVSMKGEGRGRMVGDISGTDWLDFAMSPLSYPLRMTYFGSASQRNIRTVAVEREYRARVCRECGRPLEVCGGACGPRAEARYLFDNTIRTFARDYREVRDACDELRPELRSSGKGLGDISKDVALIVSTDETLQQPYPVSPANVHSDGSGMHEGYCHDADDQRIIRDKTT